MEITSLTMPEDVLQVRSPGICFHVLRDAEGLYLLDADFVGGRTGASSVGRPATWLPPSSGPSPQASQFEGAEPSPRKDAK